MFFGAGLGDTTLAANQVLLQFLHISANGMDGFAFAVETLVGQAMGGRNRARLRRAVVVTTIWAAAVGMAMALAFALAGGQIIDWMTTAPDVRAAARHYLPWMVMAPLAGILAFQFDGVFIGATRTADMRNMMVLSALVYAATLTVSLPLLGNHGLWLALNVSYVARGLTLMARYPALERKADA